jgi:hypothetical protein
MEPTPLATATASGKKFWTSKTLWVNVLGIVALGVQSYMGYVIPPEQQGLILLGLNGLLRLFTKEPVVWQ